MNRLALFTLAVLMGLSLCVPAHGDTEFGSDDNGFWGRGATRTSGTPGTPTVAAVEAGPTLTLQQRTVIDLGWAAACALVETLTPARPCDPGPGSPPEAPGKRAEETFVHVALPTPSFTFTPPTYGITQVPVTLTIASLSPLADSAPFSGAALLLRAIPGRTWVGWGQGAPSQGPSPVVHTYSAWGCQVVRVEVTWAGEWSLDGQSWPPIGTRVTRAEVPYPVTQVVGVLVDGDSVPPLPDPKDIAEAVCDPRRPRGVTEWPAGG